MNGANIKKYELDKIIDIDETYMISMIIFKLNTGLIIGAF